MYKHKRKCIRKKQKERTIGDETVRIEIKLQWRLIYNNNNKYKC